MIREIIKPEHTTVTIEIPTSYIDKEVEFIIIPLDKKHNAHKKIQNKSLRGILNKYAHGSNANLEDSAWQKHIIDTFKHND